ncbi:bifunctional phosphoribosylaminoimidazolecarboxamide formyltransferase/IMP cyclohydrolase [Flavisolibacter ginsenosidimutans]|uniref:Bifunctional purine biosynthesis protein PurH n=1 Tax=Flavisolibacter ginsenosidimutans TaxID=661481 RepID=A0A5B8UKI6_9BACT|nr:bifunctional phosphoribosylaminoimidazolecarboxamide formyltransferase/IMP cyclohydrolase [Flavisolibacter ginsenosidimutans]QEC57201.1 bifunctional phosphoribosylaminoimidazolecarboxamide formyltransferase/IMP cyclohydrolase [Flavisolibacter ginsenosidimutans]
MNKKISAALISVFYKDGLEPVVRQLKEQGATIYSTGGTQKFIEDLGIDVIPVESLTTYPSILGGRVKTLHPSVFGGILGRRSNETDVREMQQYNIPTLDLVIVDLYPFEETLVQTKEEKLIIEKIDIGGPSMIRAAAKNFADVTVIASKDDYGKLVELLQTQSGEISLEQRKAFAAKAFKVVANYDVAINNYFNADEPLTVVGAGKETVLRYGENPHQTAVFYGDLNECFEQLHGKEISYNNLVDIDAAIELIKEFQSTTFAIIKHTNVCGIASREDVSDAWKHALAGDPESAFGGVLVCNREIDKATAEAINEIFFEVLLAPSYNDEALSILKTKKNRILLQLKNTVTTKNIYKNAVNGTLQQGKDAGNFDKWEEAGGRASDEREKEDLLFANLVCKHLKSNAIALVKNKQLVGKGCGQTSRIDALRHAVEKAKQFNFDLSGAVMASDAFFPFNDCVQLGHEAGITAFIQPGGSIRDKDSIEYCVANNLVMVMTGLRHFRH